MRTIHPIMQKEIDGQAFLKLCSSLFWGEGGRGTGGGVKSV